MLSNEDYDWPGRDRLLSPGIMASIAQPNNAAEKEKNATTLSSKQGKLESQSP